jgi:hypothetical protein
MPRFNRIQIIALCLVLFTLVPTISNQMTGNDTYWPYIFFFTLIFFTITIAPRKKRKIVVHIPDPLARVKARAVVPEYVPKHFVVRPYVDPQAPQAQTPAATNNPTNNSGGTTMMESIQQKLLPLSGLMMLLTALILFKVTYTDHSWGTFYFGLLATLVAISLLLYHYNLHEKTIQFLMKEKALVGLTVSTVVLLLAIAHKLGFLAIISAIVAVIWFGISAANKWSQVQEGASNAGNATLTMVKTFLGKNYGLPVVLGCICVLALIVMKIIYFSDGTLSETWENWANWSSLSYTLLLVVFVYAVIDIVHKSFRK